MSTLAALLSGSALTVCCVGCVYRLRTWWRRRCLDMGGGYDAAEKSFAAQIDGAFTQGGDDDEDIELSAEDCAQLQALERELEERATGKKRVAAVVAVAGGGGTAASSGGTAASKSVSWGGEEKGGGGGAQVHQNSRDDDDAIDDEETLLSDGPV